MVSPTSKAAFHDCCLKKRGRGDVDAEKKETTLGRMSGRRDKANCEGILIDVLFPFSAICFSFCFWLLLT